MHKGNRVDNKGEVKGTLLQYGDWCFIAGEHAFEEFRMTGNGSVTVRLNCHMVVPSTIKEIKEGDDVGSDDKE